MKKLVVAAVLVTALAACGKKNSGAKTTPMPDTKTDTGAPTGGATYGGAAYGTPAK